MLTSAGKSADIGEMLPMSDAASHVPGERQRNCWLLTSCFAQRCGTVHEISCCSQTADCPPATAAACADVGAGASAPPSAVAPDVEPEAGREAFAPDEFMLAACLLNQ